MTMRFGRHDKIDITPCFFWCFADEDFIGAMVMIAKKVHGVNREHRMCERIRLMFNADIRAATL